MKHIDEILLIVFSISILVNSCRKQTPACTANCAVVNANGSVLNKLTNAHVAKVPVSLNWIKFEGGFSQRQTITTVNSTSDGTFNFNSNIDTTYFNKGYYLGLNVDSNDEYIILGYSGVISKRAYSFDQNAFQGVQFDVYKKANLKLRLHRKQNDNFLSFSISHSNVADDFYSYDYNVQSPQEIIDRNTSEVNVSTVADVFTRIKVVKSFNNGTTNRIVDSIKCNATSTNVYDINF